MALNPGGLVAIGTTPLFCGHLILVNDRQMEADARGWKRPHSIAYADRAMEPNCYVSLSSLPATKGCVSDRRGTDGWSSFLLPIPPPGVPPTIATHLLGLGYDIQPPQEFMGPQT